MEVMEIMKPRVRLYYRIAGGVLVGIIIGTCISLLNEPSAVEQVNPMPEPDTTGKNFADMDFDKWWSRNTRMDKIFGAVWRVANSVSAMRSSSSTRWAKGIPTTKRDSEIGQGIGEVATDSVRLAQAVAGESAIERGLETGTRKSGGRPKRNALGGAVIRSIAAVIVV